jgi:hypothetical protein
MPAASYLGEYQTPAPLGPRSQCQVSAAQHGLPAVVGAGSNVTSSNLLTDGHVGFAVGVTSSQPGAINVQRYLDVACTVKQGAVATVALSASTPAVLNLNDGLPAQGFTVQVTNTGGSPASLTGLVILLQGG